MNASSALSEPPASLSAARTSLIPKFIDSISGFRALNDVTMSSTLRGICSAIETISANVILPSVNALFQISCSICAWVMSISTPSPATSPSWNCGLPTASDITPPAADPSIEPMMAPIGPPRRKPMRPPRTDVMEEIAVLMTSALLTKMSKSAKNPVRRTVDFPTIPIPSRIVFPTAASPPAPLLSALINPPCSWTTFLAPFVLR